jgi:hypothetical protein
MKKYIAYYRVSTRKQGDSGLGLDAQKRMVQGHVRNDVILEEFTEVESGTSKGKRPFKVMSGTMSSLKSLLRLNLVQARANDLYYNRRYRDARMKVLLL